MNRDALLATLIGFGIGLLVTGIFLVGPNFAKSFPRITFPSISLPGPRANATPAPTPTPKTADFTIDSPLPDAIEQKSEMLVSGNARAKSLVVVQGPVNEDVVSVSDDGKYAAKMSLVEGKNDITVTNYYDGKQETKTVTVYYTPEDF